MRRNIRGIITTIFAVLFMLSVGCNRTQITKSEKVLFTSFQDIPGVTEEDIKAVEELREKYGEFIFGSLAGTEAFYNKNGELRGFTAIFCEWLTGLFGIPFIPKIYEWGEIFPVLEADFTSELTATEQRRIELGYLFTTAISERSTKYFRIAGSQPRSEILKTRLLRLAFLEGSTTSRAAIRKLEDTAIRYEPFFINDLKTAYQMMESGEVDAFIHEMIVEAAFDEMGNVVVEDFLPLIYEPVSLTAQKPELAPIINIMQKALYHGITDHLINLHEQGMKEYAQHKFYMRLDDREWTYLRENVKVAYLAEFDNYPLSFYNSNERQWQGIAFDILDEITALTGLTFEPIHKPNVIFSDLMSMLESGEGAMISELIRNDLREGRFLWPSNDTLRDNFVAISLYKMPNSNVHRIMQYKVGIQTNTAYADLFNTWFPDHPNVIEYGDSDAAFNGLENGEVDIIMYSMRNLLTATHYHENPGFKANIIFDHIFVSNFGFNINEEVLCSIVDKAMDFIEKEAITAQWMRRTFDYRSKIIQSQRPWLIGSSILLMCVIILLFILFQRAYQAKQRLVVLHNAVMETNEASKRFVPYQFVKKIGVDNITKLKLGDSVQSLITVMFFDIRFFSVHSQMMSINQTFDLVNKVFGIAGTIIQKHNGFVDKYLGDAAMILFERAGDAVRAGIEIYRAIVIDESTRVTYGMDGINIGIGAHTGNVMMGVIGDTEHYASTVISKHVNTASRIEGLTKQVNAGMLISADLMHEIPDNERDFNFRYLGLINLAGSRETIGIFEILDVLPDDTKKLRLKTLEHFESAVRNFHTLNYKTSVERFMEIMELDKTDECAKHFYKEAVERVEGRDKSSFFSFNEK